MSIIWTGLAPHPPIIVDSVGRGRCSEVQTTIDSMHALCEDLMRLQPERLIVISPHTPRPASGIAAWFGDSISGNFGMFGAAQTAAKLPCDQTWMQQMAQYYPRISPLYHEPLDHGAMVPIHFAHEAGWRGPTCVLGLPWESGDALNDIASALKQTCNDTVRTAVVASGDMSHCLKPGAPSGFDRRGQVFDDCFVAHLKESAYKEATTIEAGLCEAACQDVIESCHIAWTATDFADTNHHFYSYEGPFGVGYTVMRFFAESS